jgi:two-component system, LytTR family, response regulator LytT
MKVLIIEDEKPAADRLAYLLHQYEPSIEIAGRAESIEDSVTWLKTKPHPDVIFLDIQLADGYSFEIFNRVAVHIPVIFTTAYDQYAMKAFQYFSVDYILKPVTAEALAKALNKLSAMAATLPGNQVYLNIGEKFASSMQEKKYRDRFLAKVGQRIYLVPTTNVAWFEADNKIVYLVDKEGNKYVVDFTMEKLMPLLNPADFVRINRKYIICHSAVEHIKPYAGSRMQVCVAAGKKTDNIIVSRDRVSALKDWV